jgi:FkbM family methyltransferase
MKKSIRYVVRILFNSLPLSVIKKLVIQEKFKTKTFRSYLNPGKELVININNIFFSNTKFRIDKVFPIERNLIEYGFYDENTLSLFKRLLKNGDICLDIGANIGSITFAIANFVKPNGKVFAIEPGPEPYNRLEFNLNLNTSLSQIISLHKVGFSDKVENKYWKEIYSRGNAGFNDEEGIIMKLSTLDNFEKQQEIQKIDLIKIDVEGMELEILKGGLNTLNKHKPFVYYESWVGGFPEWDRKQKSIEKLFRSIDYKLFSYNSAMNSLQETKYPFFEQNTLAVPVSRIEQLREKFENIKLITGM